MIKRHTRPNPQKNIKGGIVEKEAPIHISNVALVCKNCKKHTRIGNKVLADGRRVVAARSAETPSSSAERKVVSKRRKKKKKKAKEADEGPAERARTESEEAEGT